jgi:hypothetical protein
MNPSLWTVCAAGALLLALGLSLAVVTVALRSSRRIGAPLLSSADGSDRMLSTVGALPGCGAGGHHAYHLVEPDALRCVLCGAAGPDPLALLHASAPRVGVTGSRGDSRAATGDWSRRRRWFISRPATTNDEGLAAQGPLTPFVYPDAEN